LTVVWVLPEKMTFSILAMMDSLLDKGLCLFDSYALRSHAMHHEGSDPQCQSHTI